MDDWLLNGKKNVLWGVGEEGKAMLFDCIFQGIYIDCFCDSDPEKQGLKFLNKKIYAPEEILAHQNDYNIIVSANKENTVEIEQFLKFRKIENVLHCRDVKCGVDYPDVYYWNLYEITSRAHNQKIMIYGTDRQAAEIAYILSYLDIEVAYFIGEERGMPFCHKPVKQLYCLLDEDEDAFLLVLPTKSKMLFRQCVQMGLVFGKNVFAYPCLCNFKVERKYAIDPVLGYNFATSEKSPGIEIYGNPKAKYKIATLGGSTTDPGLYPFKCWSEILAELLMERGIDACVICGGCGGYISSQELTKLIRDLLPLHPDMVIDYTGFNDADVRRETYLFHNQYQVALAEFLSEQAKYISAFENIVMDGYTLGIKNDLSSWDEFEKNIRCMKAICDEFHIRYYAFLQPCLAIKAVNGKLNTAEKELILNSEWCTGGRLDRVVEFYSHRNNCQKLMMNFTGIFDEADVYMDICHVTEAGNRVIAEAVFEELNKKGDVWK